MLEDGVLNGQLRVHGDLDEVAGGNGMSLRSPVGPHSVWAVTDVISNSRFVMGTLLCALALLRLPT